MIFGLVGASAADLSSNRSKVIGVIIPDAQIPMFGSALVAIQDYLQSHEKNYSTMVGNTRYDANIEKKLLRQFRERNVAGIIQTGNDSHQGNIKNSGSNWDIPCVTILEKPVNPDLNFVGFVK